MSVRHCTRPGVHSDDRLCFCPAPGSGYGVRQILSQPFINGWVGELWMQRANTESSDPESTEKELVALLWAIEEAANDAYAMWRQTL